MRLHNKNKKGGIRINDNIKLLTDIINDYADAKETMLCLKTYMLRQERKIRNLFKKMNIDSFDTGLYKVYYHHKETKYYFYEPNKVKEYLDELKADKKITTRRYNRIVKKVPPTTKIDYTELQQAIYHKIIDGEELSERAEVLNQPKARKLKLKKIKEE